MKYNNIIHNLDDSSPFLVPRSMFGYYIKILHLLKFGNFALSLALCKKHFKF